MAAFENETDNTGSYFGIARFPSQSDALTEATKRGVEIGAERRVWDRCEFIMGAVMTRCVNTSPELIFPT